MAERVEDSSFDDEVFFGPVTDTEREIRACKQLLWMSTSIFQGSGETHGSACQSPSGQSVAAEFGSTTVHMTDIDSEEENEASGIYENSSFRDSCGAFMKIPEAENSERFVQPAGVNTSIRDVAWMENEVNDASTCQTGALIRSYSDTPSGLNNDKYISATPHGTSENVFFQKDRVTEDSEPYGGSLSMVCNDSVCTSVTCSGSAGNEAEHDELVIRYAEEAAVKFVGTPGKTENSLDVNYMETKPSVRDSVCQVYGNDSKCHSSLNWIEAIVNCDEVKLLPSGMEENIAELASLKEEDPPVELIDNGCSSEFHESEAERSIPELEQIDINARNDSANSSDTLDDSGYAPDNSAEYLMDTFSGPNTAYPENINGDNVLMQHAGGAASLPENSQVLDVGTNNGCMSEASKCLASTAEPQKIQETPVPEGHCTNDDGLSGESVEKCQSHQLTGERRNDEVVIGEGDENSASSAAGNDEVPADSFNENCKDLNEKVETQKPEEMSQRCMTVQDTDEINMSVADDDSHKSNGGNISCHSAETANELNALCLGTSEPLKLVKCNMHVESFDDDLEVSPASVPCDVEHAADKANMSEKVKFSADVATESLKHDDQNSHQGDSEYAESPRVVLYDNVNKSFRNADDHGSLQHDFEHSESSKAVFCDDDVNNCFKHDDQKSLPDDSEHVERCKTILHDVNKFYENYDQKGLQCDSDHANSPKAAFLDVNESSKTDNQNSLQGDSEHVDSSDVEEHAYNQNFHGSFQAEGESIISDEIMTDISLKPDNTPSIRLSAYASCLSFESVEKKINKEFAMETDLITASYEEQPSAESGSASIFDGLANLKSNVTEGVKTVSFATEDHIMNENKVESHMIDNIRGPRAENAQEGKTREHRLTSGSVTLRSKPQSDANMSLLLHVLDNSVFTPSPRKECLLMKENADSPGDIMCEKLSYPKTLNLLDSSESAAERNLTECQKEHEKKEIKKKLFSGLDEKCLSEEILSESFLNSHDIENGMSPLRKSLLKHASASKKESIGSPLIQALDLESSQKKELKHHDSANLLPAKSCTSGESMIPKPSGSSTAKKTALPKLITPKCSKTTVEKTAEHKMGPPGLLPSVRKHAMLKTPAKSSPVQTVAQSCPRSGPSKRPLVKTPLSVPKMPKKEIRKENTPLNPKADTKKGLNTAAFVSPLLKKTPGKITPKRYQDIQSPVSKYIQESPAAPLICIVKPQSRIPSALKPGMLSNMTSVNQDHAKKPAEKKPVQPVQANHALKSEQHALQPAKYIKKPVKASPSITPSKARPALKQRNSPLPLITKHIGPSKIIQGQKYLVGEESFRDQTDHNQSNLKSDMDATVIKEINVVYKNTLASARPL